MKLSFIQKFFLSVVIIAWYALPFMFFQTADRMHEHHLRYPFLGISKSCGLDEVFCFIFGLILTMGDVGITLLGIGHIVYELAYGREERKKEKERKEEQERWERKHGIVKRLADKPVSWEDRLGKLKFIAFVAAIPATGIFLVRFVSMWLFDIDCDFLGWVAFSIGALILIPCGGAIGFYIGKLLDNK